MKSKDLVNSVISVNDSTHLPKTIYSPKRKVMYSDDSFIRTRLLPVDMSVLTSFPDYRIAR